MGQRAFAGILLLAALGAPLPAAAQELLPPQPGLVVVYRYTSNQGEPPPNNTFSVVAVDGLRSTTEVERATLPPELYVPQKY